ncbi:hypothetical protein CFC21_090368 [Triticum aestivum]|uniref:RING-type E3 ubiquitin transferase n=2 Tax=Triticum aestivum TaxID=4565 RepID=A0A3B6PVG7_WHEAT|nr:RING-H2 finger protein ATL8-like [Triticum aestivum]KAF7087157.1 hypothetical protein CFC21_090368 [Triticum aestivum]
MLVPISRTNPWSHAHHAQGPAADAGAAHRESGGGGAFAPPSFLALLYLLAGLLAVYLLHAGARRLYACCVPSASPPRQPPPPPARPPCRRVDPAEVAVSLPVRAHEGDGDDDDVCAVCLTELQLRESVKAIPACGHVFHPPCIDRWLQSLAAAGAGHASCPLCRRSAADPVADDDDGPLKPPQQQQQHDEEAPAPAAAA